MSHALPREIAACRDGRGSRVGDLIRRLSSASDGEIVATVHALRRILESHGADVHALAEHVETANGGLTEEYKQKTRAEIENARAVGYAEGVKAAEARQHVPARFAIPTASSNGPRSRYSCSVRSTGSIISTTSSSTTWHRAPATCASPP